MELIKNFGVEPVLLAAQIVNFLIILWLLKKFAYKPIFKMLDSRKKTIEEGLKNAEKNQEVLERTIAEEQKILRKAQDAAQVLLADAKKQAGEISQQAEERAKKQVEKILLDAQKQISRQTEETEKQLAVHVSQLAVTMLEKSLKGLLDEKEQKKVLDKTIKKLKA